MSGQRQWRTSASSRDSAVEMGAGAAMGFRRYGSWPSPFSDDGSRRVEEDVSEPRFRVIQPNVKNGEATRDQGRNRLRATAHRSSSLSSTAAACVWISLP